eukprot:1418472-Rhodomonas_salina.1
MFTALFEHCDGVKDRPFPRAQLMVLSSYAPIQITRIRPYHRGDALDSASVVLQGSLLDIFQ